MNQVQSCLSSKLRQIAHILPPAKTLLVSVSQITPISQTPSVSPLPLQIQPLCLIPPWFQQESQALLGKCCFGCSLLFSELQMLMFWQLFLCFGKCVVRSCCTGCYRAPSLPPPGSLCRIAQEECCLSQLEVLHCTTGMALASKQEDCDSARQNATCEDKIIKVKRRRGTLERLRSNFQFFFVIRVLKAAGLLQ